MVMFSQLRRFDLQDEQGRRARLVDLDGSGDNAW